MSGIEDDFDDFDDEFGEDARPNRDNSVLRQLRKENKAKERQIKELTDRLESLAATARERSVKDVLAAKGLSPKIARFIPPDLTSEEDVSAWVEENGDVFGGSPTSTEERSAGGMRPDLSALQQIGQMQSTGQTFDGDSDQLNALIRAASSPEELNKLIFGSTTGPDAF